MEAVSTEFIQKLQKQAKKEAEAKQKMCQMLDCRVLDMPAWMVPHAFERSGVVLAFADIVYVDGRILGGVQYSVEKLMRAKSLAQSQPSPVLLVVVTDEGILGIDTSTPPSHTGISLTFRTEETDEVIPFVYYDVEQFRLLSLEQTGLLAA